MNHDEERYRAHVARVQKLIESKHEREVTVALEVRRQMGTQGPRLASADAKFVIGARVATDAVINAIQQQIAQHTALANMYGLGAILSKLSEK